MARIVLPNDRHLYGKQARLLDEANQPIGIVSFAEAIQRAQAESLDLVEMASNANPPVCRIMDYGKFQYAETKKQKQAKKNQVQVKVKEVKFHPNISDNDYQVKLTHSIEFLEKGYKVKGLMYFRGREMAHVDVGMNVMQRFVDDLSKHGTPDAPLRRVGNSIVTFISAGARKQG